MVIAVSSPNAVDVHVGGRLRLRRLHVGMNQSALAEAIGVTFQQVQKYERGANRLSASRLYAACGVLRVKPDYFFELLPEGSDGEGAAEHASAPAPLLTPQCLELAILLPKIDADLRGAILRLARILAKGKV